MRERAPGSAGGRVPDSLLPSSPPRAPPPLPAPAAASAPQSTEPPRPRGREHRPGCRCSQSPGRALTSCRRGGSPEPVRSPAAAAGSSSFWSHEGLRASGRTSPSLPARGESELRPERAWGAPAVKASRRPIRHGRRRRRERQEKVSPCPPPAASAAGAPARRRPASRAGLGVRGAAFLFLLVLPSPRSPNLAGRAPPLSTSPSWRGGRETHESAARGRGLGPARPPFAAAGASRRPPGPPQRASRPRAPFGWTDCPSPGRRRLSPSFRSFPPPVLSVSIEDSAPGGPCSRGPAPLRGARGVGRAAARLPAAAGSLPLCRRDLPRRPGTLTFSVGTCGFCIVSTAWKKLPRLRFGVTGV